MIYLFHASILFLLLSDTIKHMSNFKTIDGQVFEKHLHKRSNTKVRQAQYRFGWECIS